MLTTSPPPSVHLIGAAAKAATGVKWVADLRDSLHAHAHRRADNPAAALKEKSRAAVARLVATRADAVVAVSEPIAEEMRGLDPVGRVVTIPNGCDFEDFRGSSTGRPSASASPTPAASSGSAVRALS